jgi:hypothetical protein
MSLAPHRFWDCAVDDQPVSVPYVTALPEAVDAFGSGLEELLTRGGQMPPGLSAVTLGLDESILTSAGEGLASIAFCEAEERKGVDRRSGPDRGTARQDELTEDGDKHGLGAVSSAGSRVEIVSTGGELSVFG